MAVAASTNSYSSSSGVRNRWVQLIVGIVCMVMIANLQYGWTLFVNPIDQKYHWGNASIQVAYTTFILLETWLVPFEGYLVDRFGPRLMVAIGGLLVGLAWYLTSIADSLAVLYLGMALGGVGAGLVYGTAIGNALKWFPDHRGLASGLTAAGFGAGSALTIIPIANMIASNGYQATFLTFGLLQGFVVFIAAFFLFAPKAGEVPMARFLRQVTRDFHPLEILKQPIFWMMFAIMTAVGVGGQLATAQLAPIATDWGVDKIPVTFLAITLPALTFALALDRIMNGLTRPVTGWISDRVGREPTMTVMFALQAVTLLLLLTFGGNPVLFVLFSGLGFFSYGEIFSLFPAMSADMFGREYATTNYGLLYTSKGVASLLVPVGGAIRAATGSWVPMFALAIALNVLASVACATILPRSARAHVDKASLAAAGQPSLTPATAVAGGSE